MQMLKCNFSCITSVESTFQPTDYYRLLGWTATDQITSADPLIDRMMIPAYSSDPSNGFDISCRNAHLLSDRFTKNGTTFYIGLSAQSANYSYCNSSDIPQNHLGEYLDGSATTSGNMYSVEKNYVDKLNNPSYFCADCSCYSYNDNQYSTTNLPANRCTGSLWYTYTMLRDHSISRQIRNLNPMTIVPDAIGRINVRIKEDELLSSILLYDVSGRIIRKAENINQASFDLITEELSPGIYFLQAITTQNRKFNRSLPVPYR
ncbi:MAG: T9SS type A sorting domain-containing protein [Bacteroidetes bacterium]|nr:T9SS type A sorting domain-containing protein [Bacteroidota bacterium]